MSKYKFNITNKEFSEKEVQKYKSFSNLKNKYNNSNKLLYKTRLTKIKYKKTFFGLLLFVIIIFILFPENNYKAKKLYKRERTTKIQTKKIVPLKKHLTDTTHTSE